MKWQWTIRAALSAGLLLASLALAAAPSPEGVWRTLDDKTGAAKSLVRIQNVNGTLQGQIIEILQSDKPESEWYCTQCSGDKKDQPYVGLRILEDLTWDQGDQRWAGGTITDPANGKEYSAHLTLAEDNQSLEVRGFIGFSLIGRSQTWERVE